VYKEVPLGLQVSSAKGKVCKLRKALYRMKQSPSMCFERFFQAMQKCSHKQSQADHIPFIKHSSQGKVTALTIYVDETVLTRNGDK
jgi:hypothetical protein